MTLALYYHPLASFCHKVLVALYERETPFESRVVDLMDQKASAGFLDLWPVGKIPVLRDEHLDRSIPESSIIEFLELHYPGAKPMLPEGEDQRLEARLWDRFFDLYVQAPMQKIVIDRLRPDGANDPHGVAEAVATLRTSYDMIERQMEKRTWAIGGSFTIADCAAAPALFFADIVAPFSNSYPHTAAYFERLVTRASFARVLADAKPYFRLFPLKESMPARFL